MDFEITDDRESCRHVGLISNEVVGIQRTLQQMDTEESEMRAMLEALFQRKKALVDGTNRLEVMVRDAAKAVVNDGEQIRVMQDDFEARKDTLESQVREMEEKVLAAEGRKDTLEGQFRGMEEKVLAAEGRIKELEEKLTSTAEELKKQGIEKSKFLKIRDGVIRELKAATDSMNLLADGLVSPNDSQVFTLGETQEVRSENTRKEIKEMEERMLAEIRKLKANVRDRELAIQAKNVEIAMIKQSMDAKVENLERELTDQKEKKATRLVSFLSEIGSKKTA